MATWTLNLRNVCHFDVLPWRRNARRDAVHPSVVLSSHEARRAGSPELSQRRAEAMRGFFPKLSAWLAHRNYLAEVGEVERYLSQATDLFDLERRIRDIERRGGTSRWVH